MAADWNPAGQYGLQLYVRPVREPDENDDREPDIEHEHVRSAEREANEGNVRERGHRVDGLRQPGPGGKPEGERGSPVQLGVRRGREHRTAGGPGERGNPPVRVRHDGAAAARDGERRPGTVLQVRREQQRNRTELHDGRRNPDDEPRDRGGQYPDGEHAGRRRAGDQQVRRTEPAEAKGYEAGNEQPERAVCLYERFPDERNHDAGRGGEPLHGDRIAG